MPEVQDPPAPPAEAPKKTYTLKFEPLEDFSEMALFVKGRVRGKVWVTDRIPVVYRTLIGSEIDAVNAAVKVREGMSITQYNTESSYHNLAHTVEQVGDVKLEGTVEERLQKIRAMAAPVLTRLLAGYLEFNDRVSDLFAGKEASEIAKKS